MAKKAAKKKKAAVKDADAPVKKKKVAKKKTAKRKTRTKKEAADARVRLYWGVFNHAMKPIARYAYNQRKAAEKKATELSAGGKPQHFVSKVKETIED